MLVTLGETKLEENVVLHYGAVGQSAKYFFAKHMQLGLVHIFL